MTSYFTTPKESPVKMPSEAARAWLYRVLLAANPLLIAYGAYNGTKGALWVGLGGAVLAPGLAALNTSTNPEA